MRHLYICIAYMCTHVSHMYTYMCTHVSHMYTYMSTYAHTCEPYVHIYVHKCESYVHIYVHECAHMCTNVHLCTLVHIYVHIHAHICAHMCINVHMLHVYTYAHMLTYVHIYAHITCLAIRSNKAWHANSKKKQTLRNVLNHWKNKHSGHSKKKTDPEILRLFRTHQKRWQNKGF